MSSCGPVSELAKFYVCCFKSPNKIVFLSNKSEMQFINYPANNRGRISRGITAIESAPA